MSKFDHPSMFDGQAKGSIIAGHFNEPDTYMTKRPLGMSDWLITYTLGGEGYYSCYNQDYSCQTGDIALLKPGTPHQYGTKNGQHWHFVWAHFPATLMETSFLPDEPLLIHRLDNKTAQKRMYRSFKRVISDSIERSLYWNELCESAIREILLLLAQRTRKHIDPRIEETLHLLSQQMKETVRIDDLARAVGLSPSRLSHLFKDCTGQSIVEALNRMRLRQAALLLEHTHRNASEVAHDVGFQNYNHFTNQFRKFYGINPSLYQKSKLDR